MVRISQMSEREQLLQFVTGTSGVPAQGFRALQGNDGNIRKFTINSIPEAVSVFPKAHTCFNRIDLPLYDSKKKLQKFMGFFLPFYCIPIYFSYIFGILTIVLPFLSE